MMEFQALQARQTGKPTPASLCSTDNQVVQQTITGMIEIAGAVLLTFLHASSPEKTCPLEAHHPVSVVDDCMGSLNHTQLSGEMESCCAISGNMGDRSCFTNGRVTRQAH